MTDRPPPPARIEGGDELRAAARDLVAAVDSSLPYLTSRPDLMPRHFAALGLARCNRLLSGILTLYDNDLADTSGALLRPIYEVMLSSLYSLYGGEDAFEEIRGQYVGELKKLPNEGAIGEAKRNLVENWSGPGRRIPVEQLAQRVGVLLEERGDKAARRGTQQLYDLLYRGESLMSSHGGVGPVSGHLVDHGDRLGVARVRRDADDGTGSIVVGAVHVAMLAHHVFVEFGVGTARVDAISTRLTTAGDPERLVVDDDSMPWFRGG